MKLFYALLPLVCLVVAAPIKGGELSPIPLPDAKKAKALVDRRRSLTLEMTFDAYKLIGQRNPKWDRYVERAMQANVQRLYGPEWDKGLARAREQEFLALALEAGCADPMVRYLAAKFPPPSVEVDTERNRKIREAAKTLAASKYSDLLKIDAWLTAISVWQSNEGKDSLTQEERKVVIEFLDEALTLLAKSCRERKPNQRDELLELCHAVHQNGHMVQDRMKWFNRLDDEVPTKLDKDDPLAHAVSGIYLVEHAWEVRGTGIAARVSAPAWKLFKERLTEAEKHLSRAWELDKECASAASAMVSVCLGLEYNRATMELWFRRTLDADSMNVQVFERKAAYLLPQWYGSTEESLEFGRQILKSGRWDTGHPIMLLLAHREAAARSGTALDYFRKQPEIWKEIEPILEEMRKRYPKSSLGASVYLHFA